jgi:hypothetical protein
MAKKSIGEFYNKFPDKIAVVELPANVTKPSIWLKYIVDKDFDWVVFPGDDDLLLPKVLDVLEKGIAQNPNLSAIATKAEIIDELGGLTGEIRSFSLDKFENDVERMVRSLHQPPFFWPGLIFKASVLSKIKVDSRFVFDWAVGLQLLVSSEIQLSEEIGIQYRVHPNQESFQTSLNRKYFEGSRLIYTFIESEDFVLWIRNLTVDDMLKFWELVMHLTPVYGDNKHKLLLLDKLVRLVISSLPSKQQNQVVNQWLFMNGVLTKVEDLQSLYWGPGLDQIANNSSNIELQVIGNCEVLLKLKDFFTNGGAPPIKVSCIHSNDVRDSVFIECKILSELPPKYAADMLLNKISLRLESNGVFDFSLSPVEKRIIQFFRRYRNNKLLRKAKKYF